VSGGHLLYGLRGLDIGQADRMVLDARATGRHGNAHALERIAGGTGIGKATTMRSTDATGTQHANPHRPPRSIGDPGRNAICARYRRGLSGCQYPTATLATCNGFARSRAAGTGSAARDGRPFGTQVGGTFTRGLVRPEPASITGPISPKLLALSVRVVRISLDDPWRTRQIERGAVAGS